MGIYLNPGNGMFQTTLNGDFYIDKTGLASFMNRRIGRPNKFVCVSRPRRFGKSVDADMLVAYYTRGVDSRAQFEGCKISHDESFERHLNAHDVVKMNMVHMLALADDPAKIGEAVTRKVAPELLKAWPEALHGGFDSLPEALELAWAHKGSGFIFVIDEWDCIMREAEDDDAAQKVYLDFLRALFKDRPYVEAVYMTGILPIRKYGQHSALNLFDEFSMTNPKSLVGLFGFNAPDVERLCVEFDMNYAEMARWYDGYLLGGGLDRSGRPSTQLHVYNPNSVARVVSNGIFSNYWTATETYEALQRYIDIDYDGVASDLLRMLDGAKVPADVGKFRNTMTGLSTKDDVYALLVHLGYLGYDEIERAVFIPNEEIRREFVSSLSDSARPGLAKLARESRELIRATHDGDCAYVADALQRAHSWAASPRYYNDEQALRAAVKFAYIAALDDYLQVDELPGGRGYCDLAFVPKPGSALPPMLVELKWDKPVSAALEQARARNYPAALAGFGGECVLAGITYDATTCEHRCEIERVPLDA